MARTTADPHIRLNVSIPQSLFERLDPGRQSVSSRVAELLEAGLSGSTGPTQKAAPHPKPVKKDKASRKPRTAARGAARPAGMAWGPGAGPGPRRAN